MTDLDSICTLTLTEDLCISKSSRFNAANYLQAPAGGSNFSPLQSRLQLHDYTVNGIARQVLVESKFYCTSNLNGYSTKTETDKKQSDGYLYTDKKKTENQADLSTCAWDDSYTFPPSPSVDSGTCLHTVIDVNYEFLYENGTDISRIISTYIMADIPLKTQETFSFTKFWYEDVNVTIETTTPANQPTTSSQAPPIQPVTAVTPNVTTEIVQVLMNQTGSYTSPPAATKLTTRYKATFRRTDAVPNTVKVSGRPGI